MKGSVLLCPLMALVLTALLASPALAHARLVEEYPAEGAVLEKPPEEVRLRFDEPVEADFDPIEVYEEGGRRVDLDDARVHPEDPTVVTVGLPELPGGSYTVDWRVASTDSHPVSGDYEFEVRTSNESGASDEEEAADVEAVAEERERGSGATFALAALAALLVVGAVIIGGVLLLRRT